MPTAHVPTRRTLLTGASALAATGVLASCGRSDAADAPAPAATVTDGPATGTVEFWAGAPDGDALPPFVEAFRAENPDVTVTVTTIPSEDFDTKLTAAIASGKVPDMVFLYSQTQSTMLATGAFAAVPDGLVDVDGFFPAAVAGATSNGTLRAVPWYAYARVNYYRKDVVDALGLTPPATWAEDTAFCQALVDAGHPTPVGLAVSWDVYTAEALLEYVHQNDSSFTNADGTAWTLNLPANVEALEHLASMFTQGFSSPDGPAFLDTVPWMTSGRNLVNVSNGPWLPGFFDEANGDGWSAEHLSAYVMPAGPGGTRAGALGGGSLAVLEDGANASAAWKFVQHLSRPEVQVQWFQAFGNLPAVQSAWDDPAIADDALLAPVREALPDTFTTPAAATWGQVAEVVGKQVERVARGAATAQEALDEAQSQAESIGFGD